ncbi:hypothetical protein ABH899_004964 [Paenibacillus sp. RC84]
MIALEWAAPIHRTPLNHLIVARTVMNQLKLVHLHGQYLGLCGVLIGVSLAPLLIS